MHRTAHWPATAPPLDPVSGYLDIETTGLDARRHGVIAVGLFHAPNATPVVDQVFAEEPGEERALVAWTVEMVSSLERVVTYNGTRFDLPFLSARAARWRITWPPVVHEDLLMDARRWLRGRACSDGRLQTVLAHLNVPRHDGTTGAAVPILYRRWLREGEATVRDAVLNHNREDVVALPALAVALRRARPTTDGWTVVR